MNPPPTNPRHRAAPDAARGSAPSTRPSSLWPESTRSLAAYSTQQLSHFDPAAEERRRDELRTLAAFDVCDPALALRALVGVQAMLALGVLATSPSWSELPMRAAQGAFAGVVAVLLWLVLLCAAKPLLARASQGLRAAFVLGLGAACAGAGWLPLWVLGLSGDADGLRVVAVALVGAATAAALWGWLELRARIWQPAEAHARLVELQSRIRPHFLFNALNAALALVRVDPEKAESVLEDLSALFRAALAEVGSSVSLGEEIELAQRYLAIEQVRFGRRLTVRWDVAPEVLSARVPPLVLQPLVENAVRHGIEPASGGGSVEVQAVVRRAQVVLEVVNTLPDEADARSSAGHGMALANVRERLRLLHDVAGQCDVWKSGEGAEARFHARLIVPL
jgi:two-component system sensor histidine kinase AlgZ